MDFFEEIGRRLTDAGQGVAQQTKSLTEAAKLNRAISAEEEGILQMYADIGKLYYEAHKDEPGAEFVERMQSITEAFVRIRQYKEKQKDLKGVVQCPVCGAETSHTALFCSSCGTRLAKESNDEKKEAIGSKFCPSCGKGIPMGHKFCSICGTEIG